MNQWIGVGRVARAPEVKTFGDNKVASFRFVTNRSYKKNNEWVEESMFIDCEAWGRLADRIEEHVTLGTELTVLGRLKTDEWTNKESGEKRSKHKIYVLELSIGGGRSLSSDDESKGSKPVSRGARANSVRDIPF